MNYYRIKSPQPKCRICGRPMKEWFALAKNHVHPDCLARDIVSQLMKNIEKSLK